MAWSQTAVIHNITLTANAPAHVTHTSGSPGQMWTVPVGVKRRVQGFLTDNYVTYFAFGLMAECSTGMVPSTGCNDSYDKGNTFIQGLVGRIVVGNTTGASTSAANVYAHNYLADISESGTIGSLYVSDNANSAEDGTSITAIGGLCTSQNYTTFVGNYQAGGGPCCMGNDSDGNPSINVPLV